MKVVECSGTPRDIGHATGEALREEIRLHLERFPGSTNEQFEKRGNAKLNALRACLPHLLDEMNAMADAAGVERFDLYRSNLQLWDHRLDADEAASDGCTNIVFRKSEDGPVWGKNNDSERPGTGRPVAMRIIRPADGIPVAMIGHAGTVPGLDGMNAEGLCYGHSSVGSIFPQSDHHVDYRFWAYEGMLKCATTAAFIEHMQRHPLSGKGYAAVIVDRNGDAAALEAALPSVHVREASSRGTYCVNCYLRPELRDADRRQPLGKMHAFARSHYLSTLIDGSDETLSVAKMKSVLRLRQAPIICRHGEPFDGFHTDYSLIGIPHRGELLYLGGAPDENEYETIRF